MIEELKRKLGDEVEKLSHELNVVLPNEIRKAVEENREKIKEAERKAAAGPVDPEKPTDHP